MAFCAWCGSVAATVSYATCARCGSPTNGAARNGPPPNGNKTVLLVVGLIVAFPIFIGVLGILAAIAIPNFVTAQQRSRQKRAMAELRVVSASVETFAREKDGYPQALAPEIGDDLPNADPWGTPYRYECWPAGACTSFALASAGADGKFELESLQSYAPGGTSSFDDDLVIVDGKFVRYPEGMVR